MKQKWDTRVLIFHSRSDHHPPGNWAQCKRGGETGLAGHPFTRGQHHANKIALNLGNLGLARWEHPKNFTPWASWCWKVLVCTGKGSAPAAAPAAKLPVPRAAEPGARGSLCSWGWEGLGKTCPGFLRPSSSGLRLLATSGSHF